LGRILTQTGNPIPKLQTESNSYISPHKITIYPCSFRAGSEIPFARFESFERYGFLGLYNSVGFDILTQTA